MPTFHRPRSAVVVIAAFLVAWGCVAPSPDRDPSGISPAPLPASQEASPRPGEGSPTGLDLTIRGGMRNLRPRAPGDTFVSTCGTQLCVNGAPFRLYGASVFGNLRRPEASIRMARAAGLNTLRVTNFLDESGALNRAAYRERDWRVVDRFRAR